MASIRRGISISISVLALAPLLGQEIKLPPDLGARASETVDINLDGNLLQFAARFLSDSKPDEARAKKLIAGLKSIVVKSFEFEKPGEYSTADVEFIRAQLRMPAWSRIAGVVSKREGENAEVFVRTENDKIGGLAVIAADPKELTVVTIMGTIDPEQIAELSGHFGIPRIELEKKKKTGKDD